MNTTDIILQSGLLAALLALLGSALTLGKTWIDAKAAELKAKTDNAKLQGYIDLADDCITTAVQELNQTVVEGLKSAAADGKLSDEEKATLKAAAVSKVKQLLNDDAQEALHIVFGDAEAWISSRIEAVICQIKTV